MKKASREPICLILCMGCNNPYYLQQWQDIRKTWASPLFNENIRKAEYSNLNIIMYTSSNTDEYAYDKEAHILYVPANDSLSGTFDKTYKAIQALNMFNVDYDYILRTNCSTIVNIFLLSEFIKSKLFNPIKIYTSELFIGGWKSAPYNNSLTFRGNFMLFNRFYASLLNNTSVEMVKQVNDFNRIIHKDMFIYDDITIAAIFNTYFLTNNINVLDIYQRMPIQYLDRIYDGKESLYVNTMAFFNKTFGDSRDINEYFEESQNRLYDFCIYGNYNGLLTGDIKKLKVDFNDYRYVESHTAINETTAIVKCIPYEDLNKKENV